MKWQTMALILMSVTLSALAQIALKHGMSAASAQRALADRTFVGLAGIFTHASIMIGFALYVLGALLWLGVLAKVDVGLAYPFVALGFLVTMGFGILFLGEPFSLARAAGTCLVVAGVVVVAHAG